ncbi:hypothetical protein [Capnocytophaga leadbetteri]|uniref:hypothetical protein n=1 Tax=Capnocytophaga leadbetteri TaxID=327575 RepID=UPI0028D905D8|nr:hypothetical protein [Capnocytophaga leadbetteri]
MYSLIEIKENINKVIPFKEGIIYSLLNDNLLYDNTLLMEGIDGTSIYKISDSLIQVFDEEKGCYYIDENFNIIKSNYFLIANENSKYLIAWANAVKISRGVYNRSICLLENDLVNVKEIILEENYQYLKTYTNDVLITSSKDVILGYHIFPTNLLWEFPFSSLGKGKDYNTDEEFDYEVEQFVGIYNNILWVYIERGGFIGLDIQTGELKHRILGIPKGNLLGKIDSYVDSEEFYIFYRAKFILDEKKGIIIGLIADRFFEIDLNKEKITPMLYGMWDKMEKMNLKKYGVSGNTSLQGDLLYFYNDKELQFGILNINTKEIIYVSEPIAVVERDDSFTRLRDLKVSENKVYILDSNHTLHIFEREKLNFELGTS